jgi:lipid-binding SYLF domain-containing protein
MNITSKWKYAPGLMLATVALLSTRTASADDLTSDSRRALQQLVAQNPAAAKAKSKAVAVLVFPDVVKAGFIFGAQGAKEFFSCTANLAAATGP